MGKPNRRFNESEDVRIEELRIDGLSLGRIAKATGRPKSSIQVRLNTLARRDEEHDSDPT